MTVFSSKLPISYQLAQVLRGKIMRGDYPAGTQIAPEVQLASEYGVSVITVQRALRSLEEDRLISRHRGRGTFVLDLPSHLKAPHIPSSIEMMFSDVFDPDSETLERRLVPTPPQWLESFAGSDKVLMIRRVVRRNGRPLNYAVHHILPEVGKRIPDRLLRRYPIFRVLRDELRLPLKRIDINLKAMASPPEVSQPLELDPTAPVLYFFGALYDRGDRLLNIAEIYFCADRFAFHIEKDLTRDDPGGDPAPQSIQVS